MVLEGLPETVAWDLRVKPRLHPLLKRFLVQRGAAWRMFGRDCQDAPSEVGV